MTENDSFAADRYEREGWFRRCGRSGLMLPAISLGCWHNFGAPGTDARGNVKERALNDNCRNLLTTAFNLGITHFDLANNYGPPPGAAEERVGQILRDDFAGYRDELIVSTKAGYRMWPGPYGEWGSRKYLIASLDQSLKRLQLDYVDIFYSHRPDPDTPLEETLGALDFAVRSGRALYVGISSYSAEMTRDVERICRTEGFVRPIIHQPSYSMLNRWIEDGLTEATDATGMGIIAFCPLAQGLLTSKYLDGIPPDSRAASASGFLQAENIEPSTVQTVRELNEVATARGQTLAQMALAWTLRSTAVTSALIGASRPEQIRENVRSLEAGAFSPDELSRIDAILSAQ